MQNNILSEQFEMWRLKIEPIHHPCEVVRPFFFDHAIHTDSSLVMLHNAAAANQKQIQRALWNNYARNVHDFHYSIISLMRISIHILNEKCILRKKKDDFLRIWRFCILWKTSTQAFYADSSDFFPSKYLHQESRPKTWNF